MRFQVALMVKYRVVEVVAVELLVELVTTKDTRVVEFVVKKLMVAVEAVERL